MISNPSFSAAERQQRSVFVGNVSFDTTDEKMAEIFSQVGVVKSFRIVHDKDTGKPKGFGFCEFDDKETADAAIRNLNNYELHGRFLRVSPAVGRAEEQLPPEASGPLVGGSPYGPPVEPSKAPEQISRAVASLPPEQMFNLMKQMKACIQHNPQQARTMLLENPQLAYALLQAQIVMKIVDPQVAIAMLHRENEIPPPMTAPSDHNQPPGPPPAMRPLLTPTSSAQMDHHRPGPSMYGGGVMPPQQQPPPAAQGGRGPLLPGGPPGGQYQNRMAPGHHHHQQPMGMRGPAPGHHMSPQQQPRGGGGPGPASVGPGMQRPLRPQTTQPSVPGSSAAVLAAIAPSPPSSAGGGGPSTSIGTPSGGAAGASGAAGTIQGSAAAAGASVEDQEKAMLIMQVLQLTDEQIARLPDEQRNSIMILKEQFNKTK